MIENLTDLEKSLKLEEGSLQKAIDNEENVKIELPSLIIRTTADDDLRTSNLENEARGGGKSAGREQGFDPAGRRNR